MTAPASPRRAEELVEKAAALVWIAGEGPEDNDSNYANCPLTRHQAALLYQVMSKECCREAATAIITLAQDAKLREVAEECERRAAVNDAEAKAALNEEWARFYSGRAMAVAGIASHLRAMMVKP